MEIKQTLDSELISSLNREVQNLHAELYPSHFKDHDHAAVSVYYKSIMTKPNFQFYIAEDSKEALGYVWIEIKEYNENPFRKSYKSVYVHQLSILEKHRFKGLGKKLMDHVKEIAEMHEIRKIELDYWVDNEMAKAFYNRNGYRKYREFVYKDL